MNVGRKGQTHSENYTFERKKKKQISDLATKSSSSSCKDRLTETKHIILPETSEEEHTVLDNSFQDIGY